MLMSCADYVLMTIITNEEDCRNARNDEWCQ